MWRGVPRYEVLYYAKQSSWPLSRDRDRDRSSWKSSSSPASCKSPIKLSSCISSISRSRSRTKKRAHTMDAKSEAMDVLSDKEGTAAAHTDDTAEGCTCKYTLFRTARGPVAVVIDGWHGRSNGVC